MFVTLFAVLFYPPLGWDAQPFVDSMVLLFVTVLSIPLRVRLTRYVTLVRAMSVLASAASLILAAFVFLNGALDYHPPVEADALVSAKYAHGYKGSGPSLGLSIAWNQERIEEGIRVNRKTFAAVEPGDSVHVTIHPGAFSAPWYSNGVTLNSASTSDSSPDEH